MRVAILLFVVPLLSAACGSSESQCEKYCDSIREQLIMNFDVQPTQINCSDSQWDTSCQQCLMILETDFGVEPTTGLQECESM